MNQKIQFNPILNILLKAMLLLGLGWVLYQKLFENSSWLSMKAAFLNDWEGVSWPFLIIVVLLMPLNWSLEAFKWLCFLPKDQRPSIRQSLRVVCSGVTCSMVLPNRTGDYLGRALAAPKGGNANAVVASLAGNFCQLLVLFGLGLPALLWFVSRFLQDSFQALFPLILTALGVILILILGVLFSKRLLSYVISLKLLSRFRAQGTLIRSYGWLEFLSGLGLSLARYLIYSSQYYLMLRFVGVELPLIASFCGIWSIFLIQSSVPLPPVLGLVARGEIALLIWGIFNLNPLQILTASYSLFVINLVVPALAGLVTIIQINLVHAIRYENNSSEKSATGDIRPAVNGAARE